MPTAFGSPVVPLVNRIKASRSSWVSVGSGTGEGVAGQIGRRQNRGRARVPDSVGVRLPRDATSAQPAFFTRPCNSGGVRAGFISAAAAPIRAAPSTIAIDSRLPVSTTAMRLPGRHAVGDQAGGALSYGRVQLAVVDRAAVDDDRNPGGITGRGGVDDRARVHPRPSRGGTTRRSAAIGWSTGRAGPGRRASRCQGRGTRPGYECAADRAAPPGG